MLQHWRLYIIRVPTLQVEVNAKYIQGLLNNPDLQLDTAVNRWIQGILMFHFALIHVPATRFQGPDALSQREPAEGELVESDDDSRLNEIALYIETGRSQGSTSQAFQLPSCHLTQKGQENFLQKVLKFLTTLEAPAFDKPQKHARFIQQAIQYFIHDGNFLRRNKTGPPLTVILEPTKPLRILEQSHDDLGHRGVQAVWDLLKVHFY